MTLHTKPQPEMGRIALAVETFGLSRSGLYRLASEGRIRMVKVGRSTLVDFASVRALQASLPAANIRPSHTVEK